LKCPFHIDVSTLEGENTGLLHTFRANHAVMWSHIPEGWRLQLHCCESLKIYERHTDWCISWNV